MVINNTTASPLNPLFNAQQPVTSQLSVQQTAKPEQGSSTVTLSAQGQQMSRAEAQQVNGAARAETRANVNTERTETRPQERSEPPGIQFMAGEEKSGRVSTYA